VKIITNLSIEGSEQIVATVGFFDGVHRGHQYIIEQLKKVAKAYGLKSAVITFRTHPRKELHSEFVPQLLTTLDEKLDLLSKTGIDYCLLLDFNPEIQNLTAEDFIKTVLKEKLNTHTLLIGHDNKIGKGRREEFEKYEQYGNEVGLKVIKTEESNYEGKQVSSSEIRRLMSEGDIAIANKLLGYTFQLTGKVVEGEHIGRKIGYPTANLSPVDNEKIVPANGVYATWAYVEGEKYMGMLNIGHRPTLIEEPNKETIEVHIIDFDKDIYGKEVTIEIVKKLRSEKKFESLKALKMQIDKDKKMIIKILEKPE
jgi:riboflavin kinase/FMN adenylyltransferase